MCDISALTGQNVPHSEDLNLIQSDQCAVTDIECLRDFTGLWQTPQNKF